MMARKLKDWNWNVTPQSNGAFSHPGATVILLMDIRDELKEANRRLSFIERQVCCRNATRIPRILQTIEENTRRKPRVKKEPA